MRCRCINFFFEFYIWRNTFFDCKIRIFFIYCLFFWFQFWEYLQYNKINSLTVLGNFNPICEKWHQPLLFIGHSKWCGHGATIEASSLVFCNIQVLKSCMNLNPLGLPGSITINIPLVFNLFHNISITNNLCFDVWSSCKTYPRITNHSK